MYLKEINIENYGSIEKLNYKMPFKENGEPKPVVVIGKNGSGKTLLISNIVHTLIEIKRRCFSDTPETDSTHYYRVGSKEYIKSGTNYSYINYLFDDDISLIDFITNNYDDVKEKKFEKVNMQDENLKNNGFFQNVKFNNKNEVLKVFDENMFMYLPVDRYYSPNWLNNSNPKLKFNTNYDNYVGQNDNNLIKSNLLDGIESWILDVIIDKLLYEEQMLNTTLKNGHTSKIKIYSGKNSTIQNIINDIMTKIIKISNPNVISARIGISQKDNRSISILYKTNLNEIEKEYVPKFSNLSSGEIMILGMVVAILKEFDRIFNIKDTNLKELKGIVVIDEIDAHLHLDFCRIILPSLIEMFPKVQFIITSHSPFFLLGMKEKFEENCEFLNMPDGYIDDLNNFEEIKKMYDLVENDYSQKMKEIKEYKLELEKIYKPIVITEGKTDWKHLKNALNELHKIGKCSDVDVDFLEYTNTMGDSNLENLLKSMAMFNNSQKIIGIFDSDEKTGAKYDNPTYTFFENNVYGWCIPNPRNLPYGISIEFLYSDSDIKIKNSEGKRLYLTDEFKEKNLQCKSNSLIVSNNRNFIQKYYTTKQVKILEANEVFDENENSIALSKNEFADNIYNKVPPFDKVDVSNFEELFNRIGEILKI